MGEEKKNVKIKGGRVRKRNEEGRRKTVKKWGFGWGGRGGGKEGRKEQSPIIDSYAW